MELTVLMENTAPEGLRAEHGLSLYVQAMGKQILFDAGQRDSFLANAQALGIDLSQTDLAILSHGHYDHSGGFLSFFQLNATAPLYLSPHAPEPHYNPAGKYIGIDPALSKSPRLRFDGNQLGDGLRLVTLPDPPKPDPGFTAANGQPDDFRHEQYLLIEDGGKRILLSGCSHRGIVAIAEHFRPDILIGGFHFKDLTDEPRLRRAAQALLACPTQYYTCHCTGLPQYQLLKGLMGSRLEYLSTGDRLVTEGDRS